MEKTVDRIDRINRQIIGLSSGVLIHFQFHVSDFSNKKTVSATKVTICIMVTAQSCTDARARGVKIRRAYRA